MNRTVINFLIDSAAAILMFAMALTGYILWIVLPPGTQKEFVLWGIPRHSWGVAHAWIGLALSGAALLHAGLHWQWIDSVARRWLGVARPWHSLRSGLATIGLLATVFAFGAVVAHSGVDSVESIDSFCSQVGVETANSGPNRAGTIQAELLWSDLNRVFERSCLRCHGPVQAKGNFRVDRPQDFLRHDDGNPALVVPGKSAESPLVAIVSGQRVRQEAHRLGAADMALLRTWIDAGANWPEQPTKPEPPQN